MASPGSALYSRRETAAAMEDRLRTRWMPRRRLERDSEGDREWLEQVALILLLLRQWLRRGRLVGLFDTEPLPPPLPLPPPAPAAGATAADMSDTDPTEPLDFMDLLLDDEPWSDLRWHRSFSAGSVSSSPGTAATAFFACATTVAALSRAAACAARV